MKRVILVLLITVKTVIFSLDEYIGFTPTEVIDVFGAPDYMYTERGDREEADDIVYYYNNRLYIYFNQNRVWQVRADGKFELDVLNVRMGDNRSTVIEILGEAYKTYEDSILYRRPDKGYPLFLRIYFSQDKVNDIYLFRGDY